ncbi:MAG: hypothetical protein EOP22_17205 [Hyphomicrobiales bacterium]|nr:MAG: hypothetical protein EOP22_17205 [Hyphomicrobiales bacterium]
MRIVSFLAFAGLMATPAVAQSVESYGDDWYRAPFWSGEYPAGFTVLKDTVVQLRPALSPTAAKTVDCPLPAKATYQQWNGARVEAEGLHFVSFTEIDEMEVTAALDTSLFRNDDGTSVDVGFKPGDKWRYLAYFGEGAFLMEYDGVRYEGDQGLMEVSKSLQPGERGYEQWLRINCANNQWGWLFFGDIVQDDITFTGPNIVEYGRSADLE